MLSKLIKRFKNKRKVKALNKRAREIIEKAKEQPLTQKEKDDLQSILTYRRE